MQQWPERREKLVIRRTFLIAIAFAGSLGATFPSSAQEIQERTIHWGHLNNTDHPVSLGVKRFTEIVAAKLGLDGAPIGAALLARDATDENGSSRQDLRG